MDSELQQLAKTDRNPAQESRYRQLLSQSNLPYYQGGNATNTADFNNFAANSQPQQQVQSAQQAQTAYQAGIGSAVSTLQSAGTSLADQYKSLLNNVLGQGTVAMNTVTTGENNLLGQRGITNNSPLYSQQMSLAQLPVQQANQAAVSNLGFTEAGLQNQLAQSIAGIQQGGAQFAAGLPLQYGQLALQQAANVANIGLTQAQTGATRYIPIPGYGVYDFVSKQLVGGLSGIPGQGVTNINGVPSLYIP